MSDSVKSRLITYGLGDEYSDFHILLIGNENNEVSFVEQCLNDSYFKKATISHVSYSNALENLKQTHYDVIFLDIAVEKKDTMELITQYKEFGVDSPIIVVTTYHLNDHGIEFLKRGAFDYIDKENLNPSIIEKSIRYCLERSRDLKSLKFRSKIENLITRLSTKFINCDPTQLKELIMTSVEEMCKVVNAVNGSLFKIDPEHKKLIKVSFWHRHEGNVSLNQWKSIELSELKWLEEKLRCHQIIYIPSIDDIPLSAVAERSFFKSLKVESIAIVPIKYANDHVSLFIIAFDYYLNFKKEFVKLLPLMGEVFVNALSRLHSETIIRQKELELRHAQKMEAIGELAGGIAHDFNNMLVVIGGYSDLILTHDLDQQVKEDLEEIRSACKRATSITRQLLAFSRRQVMQPKLINVNEVIINLEKMLRRIIGDDICLFTELEKIDRVLIDPGQLEQVLVNLVINARDAMPDGGNIVIKTKKIIADQEELTVLNLDVNKKWISLDIEDTGVGMSPVVLANIFKPFFTTKKIGRGTGLGLSTAYGIIRQSGGVLKAKSKVNLGTIFTIYLPAQSVLAIENYDVCDQLKNVTGNETILIIDHDGSVLDLMARMLSELGYHCLLAQSYDEAEIIFQSHIMEDKVDLLVADVITPQTNAHELEEKLKKIIPELKVLYVSGYSSEILSKQGINFKRDHLIFKPFNQYDLGCEVRKILDEEN